MDDNVLGVRGTRYQGKVASSVDTSMVHVVKTVYSVDFVSVPLIFYYKNTLVHHEPVCLPFKLDLRLNKKLSCD